MSGHTHHNDASDLQQLRRILSQAGEHPDVVLSPQAEAAANSLWSGLRSSNQVRPEVLHALGWLLWFRSRLLPEGPAEKDLANAVSLLRPIYRMDPDMVPGELRAYLSGTGPLPPSESSIDALGERAVRTLQQAQSSRDLSALDAAIALFREGLRQLPAGHPKRSIHLSNLAAALGTRYELTGQPTDLRRAIPLAEAAMAATAPDDPRLPLRRHTLAVLLRDAALAENLSAAPHDELDAERSQARADLNEAIGLWEHALSELPYDYPARGTILRAYATALMLRLHHRPTPEDEDRLADALQAVVDRTPAAAADRLELLDDLALALMNRTNRPGLAPDLPDLDRAADATEQALQDTGDDDPARATRLWRLSTTLAARSRATGSLADVDRAVALGQASVETLTDTSQRRAALADLANTLLTHFQLTSDIADLDRCIDYAESSLSGAALDEPLLQRKIYGLARVLLTRFFTRSQASDLERVIMLSEHALRLTPPGHPDRASMLNALARALRLRFDQTGDSTDLDRAIELLTEAAAANTQWQGECLNNLANALSCRYEQASRPADLEQSIAAAERALTVTAPDHPDVPKMLTNLAVSLAVKHFKSGDAEAIERAVQLAERALEATRPGDPQRGMILLNLSSAIREHVEGAVARAIPGSISDIDRAVGLAGRAVDETPEDSWVRASVLKNLGHASLTRFALRHDTADLQIALSCLRQASSIENAPPLARAQAAQGWAAAAQELGDTAQAVEAYTLAIHLIGQVAPLSLRRPDQERQLTKLAGLGSEAAAACLAAGRSDLAVELLEQGRAVLFGLALDARTDVTDLAATHPEEAARLVELLRRLQEGSDPPRWNRATTGVPAQDKPASTIAGAAAGAEAAASAGRWSDARELQELLTRIRAYPGLDRFLLPRPISELLQATQRGPVVVVNVARSRSDALILTSGGVEVLPLQGVDPPAVLRQFDVFWSALADSLGPSTPADRVDRGERALSEVLQWLWDHVTGPVVDHLDLSGAHSTLITSRDPDRPHVHWCPTGLLCLLPLHAAGHHDTRRDPVPATVLDRVISSTVPTVRALVPSDLPQHAPTSCPDDPLSGGRALVVAAPSTPGRAALPGAAKEAALISRMLPGRVDVLGLSGTPQATHGSVLAGLTSHQWVHFACHASNDPFNPSASRLLLEDDDDDPLTVLDLTRARLPEADMAFLAACSTARTGLALPDEPIHLAAAFRLAGFRHVIATLWPVTDDNSLLITRAVYASLLGADGAERWPPAVALHAAVRRVRALFPERPSRWAAHLHVGC